MADETSLCLVCERMIKMKKAVVLLSGGLDSTTALYLAKKEGFEVYALCFDYGQRHKKEVESAQNVADAAGVKEMITIKTNMNAWGGSALTDNDIVVPETEKKFLQPMYRQEI